MPTISVTIDNFIRAESDTYMATFVRQAGLGRFQHLRTPASVDDQTVVRMNRDTLYSSGVFDLAAGPVTIALPDARGRYMAMQAIDQDHYVVDVVYEPGPHTFTEAATGTRYLTLLIRTLVDPEDPADVGAVHALQDAITVEQAAPGSFEIPEWDQASLSTIRDALKTLGSAGLDFRQAFGRRDQVNPIHHLIGTAVGWGGNPREAAIYDSVYPAANDGRTVHRLTVRDVPVDGFWSISIYNPDGFFEKNNRNAYTINNLTATPAADGTITVQFGGCDDDVPNCLPIMPGWNYTVRLYRPRPELLDGSWDFPVATPA